MYRKKNMCFILILYILSSNVDKVTNMYNLLCLHPKGYMNQFCWGSKNDPKDLMFIMPKVNTLSEFITQAIACDNHLFERQQ